MIGGRSHPKHKNVFRIGHPIVCIGLTLNAEFRFRVGIPWLARVTGGLRQVVWGAIGTGQHCTRLADR